MSSLFSGATSALTGNVLYNKNIIDNYINNICRYVYTDVLNDIPKAIGMKMAIRSMAPQIIAADEIGSVDDVNAIQYAICCGIKGIFTAHGNSVEDVKKNTELKSLIDNKIFEKFIFGCLFKKINQTIFGKQIFQIIHIYKIENTSQFHIISVLV